MVLLGARYLQVQVKVACAILHGAGVLGGMLFQRGIMIDRHGGMIGMSYRYFYAG